MWSSGYSYCVCVCVCVAYKAVFQANLILSALFPLSFSLDVFSSTLLGSVVGFFFNFVPSKLPNVSQYLNQYVLKQC